MKKILVLFLLLPGLSWGGHLKSDDLTGKSLICEDYFFYFKKFYSDTFIQEYISSDYRLFLEGYTEIEPLENDESYQQNWNKNKPKDGTNMVLMYNEKYFVENTWYYETDLEHIFIGPWYLGVDNGDFKNHKHKKIKDTYDDYLYQFIINRQTLVFQGRGTIDSNPIGNCIVEEEPLMKIEKFRKYNYEQSKLWRDEDRQEEINLKKNKKI